MNKLIINLGIIILLTSLSLHAQVRELSLDDALKIALENNKSIKSAKFRERLSKAELHQSRSSFLPSVELSVTGVHTNDPLASFGFKLKQEIVTQADFSPVLLNDPLSMDHFSTKLELKLPLINMDGFHMHKAAKLNYKANTYMKERNIHYVMFEVKKYYYSLLLADEVIRVVNESFEVAKSALKMTKDNLEVGYAKDADVLMAKVRLGDIKAKLLEAKNMRSNTVEHLVFLLGLEEGTEINPTDSFSISPKFELKETNILNRSDILAVKTSVNASKHLFAANKSNFLPRINAFGSTEWNDNKLLGSSAKNYTIGAMFSWKLFNGYKNIGSLQKAKAQYEKAKNDYSEYLSKNKLEVFKAQRDLELAFEQTQIKKLGQKQAAASFRIMNNRYAEGLEKTVDLLYAENLASNRKLEFVESLYKYQIALFYMELLLEK